MAHLELILPRGTSGKMIPIHLTGGTPPTGATGLTATSMAGFYIREGATNAVALSLVTSGALGTFTSGSVLEIFSSMSAGVYQFCPPNAALSTTATTGQTYIWLGASSGTLPVNIRIQLTEADLHNGANLGLTSLPTATAGALLGLPLNGLQIPSGAAGTTSGIAVVGIQIPTGSAGYTMGLPVVGAQLGTATLGMVGGLPAVGRQVPSVSAGVTGGLPLIGTQIPTASYGASGGLPIVGQQIPTASIGASGSLLTSTSYVGVTVATTAFLSTMADAFLDRDMGTGTDSGSSAVRTVRQALRPLRNKILVSTGGTLTVYKEDDITASWSAAVATNSNAVQIIGVNPA